MPYRESTLRAFLDAVAAKTPTPGGGSVSALAAALGAAIGAMAAAFTETPAGREAGAALREALEGLLPLVDADAAAYGAVHRALQLPRGTPEEKRARAEILQAALREAADVPLDGMRRCVAALERTASFAAACNPNLRADLGVSSLLLEAACRGAGLNVGVNLQWIADPSFASPRAAERADLEARALGFRNAALAACSAANSY